MSTNGKNESISTFYNFVPYYYLSLDPIHVGIGGYRIGEVDNIVVREPSSRIPYIPATTIAGASRAYSALIKQKLDCAHQQKMCGKDDCPICFTYGFTNGNDSRKSKVIFYDLNILLFPIRIDNERGYITSPNVIRSFFLDKPNPEFRDDIQHIKDNEYVVLQTKGVSITTSDIGKFNLEKKNSNIDLTHTKTFNKDKLFTQLPSQIRDYLDPFTVYMVSDRMFSILVNDNMEVRTSVSIDPMTGSAISGGLYTYESIPRFTIFHHSIWFEKELPKPETNEPNKAKVDIQKLVKDSFQLIEGIGLGGMTTRGMGRLKQYEENTVSSNYDESMDDTTKQDTPSPEGV